VITKCLRHGLGFNVATEIQSGKNNDLTRETKRKNEKKRGKKPNFRFHPEPARPLAISLPRVNQQLLKSLNFEHQAEMIS
jgi:hypothetical protein